jgi:hypothetical protein
VEFSGWLVVPLPVLGVFHSVGIAVGDDDGGVVQEAVTALAEIPH